MTDDIGFDRFELNPMILDSVNRIGFRHPTSIQKQIIPQVLNGISVRGIAETGSGKTAAYLLPVLSKLVTSCPLSSGLPVVLVVVPTRELAEQVFQFAQQILESIPSIAATAIYGGVDEEPQIAGLNSGASVVVGTPGRLLDLMDRGYLKLEEISFLVLDEVDHLLSMGFREDLNQIMMTIQKNYQSLFLSATINEEILELSRKIQGAEVYETGDSLHHSEVLHSRVEQDVFYVDDMQKGKLLADLLIDFPQRDKVLVFVRTRKRSSEVAQFLQRKGFAVDFLHGQRSQEVRSHLVKEFEEGLLRILVATDVAARGLDFSKVRWVVNYDLPLENETYVHRIGRSGRAGQKGQATTFVEGGQRRAWAALERFIGIEVSAQLDHPYKVRPSKPRPTKKKGRSSAWKKAERRHIQSSRKKRQRRQK
ncbi:MAG: DEAD/DEAH box helicase [Bdellovibrionales bacterium]|nr:DEAD/DEAH box helicase [Bdellovibrionales bacterium]